MAYEGSKQLSNSDDVTTEEYRLLFNTISDCIEDLEQIMDRLKAAQATAEDLYARGCIPKEPLLFLPHLKNFRAVK